MTIIRDITRALHDLFTTVADEAARVSGFVQRASKCDGPAFVQTLVFTSLSDPQAAAPPDSDAAVVAHICLRSRAGIYDIHSVAPISVGTTFCIWMRFVDFIVCVLSFC
jgi:hypothetical protein